MFRINRSVLAALALALPALGGCTVESDSSEPTREEVIDELQTQAEALLSTPDAEVPYGCEIYGDCVYCENSYWFPFERCAQVCYFYACPGDSGSGCYDDCGLRA